MGVRDEKPPGGFDGSRLNTAVPTEIMSSCVTSINGPDAMLRSPEFCLESDLDCAEVSEVGEVEAGDDGCDEVVDAEKDDEA